MKTASLYTKLFPFQKEIVDKYRHKKKFGLFLDMGLGKTITSLSFCEVNNINKIIVIALKSKTTETEKLSGSFDYYLNEMGFNINKIDKIDGDFKLNTNKEALVINYEKLFKRGADELNEVVYSFINQSRKEKIAVVVDESHKIKNPSSKNSKILKKICNLISFYGELYLYLLTGTPWTKDYLDLHNQLKFLGCEMSRTKFIETFAIRGDVPGLLNWQQPVVGFKNLEELFKLVGNYAISELTESNIKLPEQVFVDIKTPYSYIFNIFLSPKISQKEHSNLLRERGLEVKDEKPLKNKVPNMFYRNLSYPKLDWFADTPASLWLRARQLSVGFQGNEEDFRWYDESRLEKLKKFLDEKRDNYIIFYNYTPEFFKLFEICESLGYKIDVYNGLIKDLTFYDDFEKMDEQKRFNATKRVIITNYASGSTGKNWQLYNKTIFFSIPLYGVYAQALKRNHRIGQNKPVYYYMFSQENFLDEGMIEALTEKVDYNYDMFTYQLENNEKKN